MFVYEIILPQFPSTILSTYAVVPAWFRQSWCRFVRPLVHSLRKHLSSYLFKTFSTYAVVPFSHLSSTTLYLCRCACVVSAPVTPARACGQWPGRSARYTRPPVSRRHRSDAQIALGPMSRGGVLATPSRESKINIWVFWKTGRSRRIWRVGNVFVWF